MRESTGKVLLLDDDESILRSVGRLLGASGYHVLSFQSARALLDSDETETADCIILDLGLPDSDGLHVQETLAAAGGGQSIVFLTGRGDIPASVRAMKAGAVDFLTKPVEAETLLAAVNMARQRACALREVEEKKASVVRRLRSLTAREAQVMHLVVAGRLNKQIAADLGTVEKTIKVHRGRMMTKLGVRTVADLVRLVAVADPPDIGPKSNYDQGRR
ncbi:response regulator [Sinorhizobium meliloti]|uniref:response regulator transcription factor n=1 Tax=Rhizobium meliloti TaxID=382 RepID=UPI000B5A60A4|nr:response regulator [Sinorhizobium meliloti]ASJ61420.1 DNA-binding response regulator [Sinorhizobium meliloti]MCK3785534.1 response regulator transcription factor [Sinorhizobium meliloti]MCK3791660.1 response regulator transcription factor [Sinorhizobium meliloti]MCK3797209.1 response regulator transcription factor [Sinorhizobium meliloti]MDW9490321.1 response regulator [Sinorhizobium meliloti]